MVIPQKKIGFHPSGANKMKKTVSNCLRNKKRVPFVPKQKRQHLLQVFPNKKENIYYIGNSRRDFIRGLKAKNAINDSYGLVLGLREAQQRGRSDRFFYLSPLLWMGATMGGHGHFSFKKIDHQLGEGGRLRVIGKSHVS